MSCCLSLGFRQFCFVLFRLRLFAFTEAAALRSIVLRSSMCCAPTATRSYLKIHRFSVCDSNIWIGVNPRVVVAPFARRHLWCICAAISVGSQCVVARFARRHLWGICGAVSVGSQCVVARFARGHLWCICAAVSPGSQCVVARFAQKHLTGICAAVSVESQ